MSVRVLLPNAFQKHTNNVREIASTAANLSELVTDIEGRFPALRQHLRGQDGQIRRFINFYVNEEDIRFLGNEKYSFKDGDEVLVIPPSQAAALKSFSSELQRIPKALSFGRAFSILAKLQTDQDIRTQFASV